VRRTSYTVYCGAATGAGMAEAAGGWVGGGVIPASGADDVDGGLSGLTYACSGTGPRCVETSRGANERLVQVETRAQVNLVQQHLDETEGGVHVARPQAGETGWTFTTLVYVYLPGLLHRDPRDQPLHLMWSV